MYQPFAQGQQRQHAVFLALARNRCIVANISQLQPIASGVGGQLESRGIGYQRHVFRQGVQAVVQRSAGQHGIADHVEIEIPQRQFLVQTQGFVLGPCHGQFPQAADQVHIKAGIRVIELFDVQPGSLEQARHVHAPGREHGNNAFEPAGRTGSRHGNRGEKVRAAGSVMARGSRLGRRRFVQSGQRMRAGLSPFT